MPDTLHLVKIPLNADKLWTFARGRGLPLRDLDEGYLAHCIMRELWQDRSPAPFVLRSKGRAIDAWGYSRADAAGLIEHARAFGDPSLLVAMGDLASIASKEMPCFENGRRVGFLLRACPIVRLARENHGHRAGAEVDAFLARCFAAGDETEVSREEVYREWLSKKLQPREVSGVAPKRVRVAGMARERVLRRTQGAQRKPICLERPDVRFEGDLEIVDGERFLSFLGHGVGRHRAFGFGALILVPPGTSQDS